MITPIAPLPAHANFTLAENWDREVAAPMSLFSNTPELLESLRQRHVVFITGVMNEFTRPFYFKAFRETLEQDLKMTTSRFDPSSLLTPEANAKILNQYLQSLDHQRKKEKKCGPIILVGHSKGGAEIFYTAQQHSDLILNGTVENMLIIQGAIQGSQLLQDDRAWWPIKIVKNHISPWFGNSYQSLDTHHAIPSCKRLITEFREFCKFRDPSELQKLYEPGPEGRGFARFNEFEKPERPQPKNPHTEDRSDSHPIFKMVSNKLHYVLTHEDPENQMFLTRTGIWWCGNDLTQIGKNDGFLALEHQMHADIGNVLGEVRADHSALALSPPSGLAWNTCHRLFNLCVSGVQLVENTGLIQTKYSKWLLRLSASGRTPEEQKAFIRAAIYEMYAPDLPDLELDQYSTPPPTKARAPL